MLGISTALPFLIVRCVYSVLSALSPISSFGPSTANLPAAPHSALSEFNSFSGSWLIFLLMSLVMEYIVVLIYLTVGALTPLETPVDEEVKDVRGRQGEYRYHGVNGYGNGQQGYTV